MATDSELSCHVCSAELPWQEGLADRCRHPDAEEIAEADHMAFSPGNKTTYQCPHCQAIFTVQEPDY